MTLSDKLKTIYTSGNDYTVLQLLNKLIEEIKAYEIQESDAPMRVIDGFIEHPEDTQGWMRITPGFRIASYMPIVICIKPFGYDDYKTVLAVTPGVTIPETVREAVIDKDSEDFIEFEFDQFVVNGYPVRMICFEDTKEIGPLRDI